MCKINGHSIFTYRWDNKGWKRFGDKNREATAAAQKKLAEATKRIEELSKPEQTEPEGELPVPVAPIKTDGTGINNTAPRLGLNL